MSKGIVLSRLELDVLYIVRDGAGAAYGMTIRQTIEAEVGHFVSIGDVYLALGKLEQAGFVTSRIGEATPERGGRRKRYYALTKEGAAFIAKFLSKDMEKRNRQ